MFIEGLKKKVKPYTWLRYMLAGGHMQGDELQHSRRFFSQFGEDAILENWFWGKVSGFYVEVGAFDPLIYSNTYWFYAKGWNGICIEPNPSLYSKFCARRARDKVLNVAVSNSEGEADFVCSGVYSGIVSDSFAVPEKRNEGEVIKVKTIPLRKVLQAHVPADTVIDFMTIDCEGHDLAVLESNDWKVFRPSFVLVEDHAGDPRGELYRKMLEWDYEFIYRIGLTAFFRERGFALV